MCGFSRQKVSETVQSTSCGIVSAWHPECIISDLNKSCQLALSLANMCIELSRVRMKFLHDTETLLTLLTLTVDMI